jgi:hypothetical protein
MPKARKNLRSTAATVCSDLAAVAQEDRSALIDLHATANAIRHLLEGIRFDRETMQSKRSAVGAHLIAVKAQLEPGRWLAWLREELCWRGHAGERRAQRFMAFARHDKLSGASPKRPPQAPPVPPLDPRSWTDATTDARRRFITAIGVNALIKILTPSELRLIAERASQSETPLQTLDFTQGDDGSYSLNDIPAFLDRRKAA